MFPTDTAILAYHQITRDDEPKNSLGFAIPVSQFERQMRYLSDHGYRCLPLTELLQPSGNTFRRQKKSFALTFDDGYEDFLRNAYPILRRYGFTATVFLVTDLVGKQSDWEKEMGTPLLTWEQIKALSKDSISFGNHTCTHPHLPHLPHAQVWHELTVSKQCLEAKLGREIPLLSYPYGESNQEIRKSAMAAGYMAAFGISTGSGGRFNIWRTECHADDNLQRFIFKLSRFYRYLTGLRIWLREDTALGRFLRTVKYWYCGH